MSPKLGGSRRGSWQSHLRGSELLTHSKRTLRGCFSCGGSADALCRGHKCGREACSAHHGARLASPCRLTADS